MLVILSWISFWLNQRASHVRLVICALSVLLLAIGLQINSTEMPKTAYIKAYDVYTGVCMTFVFAALMGKCEILLENFKKMRSCEKEFYLEQRQRF